MADPAWWGPKADKRRQNSRSAAQERRIAREEGGRVQPGSGSSWRARGDVKTEDDLIEVKYTDAASFRLVEADWQEHRRRSLTQGKNPVMIVEFSTTGTRIKITEG